MPHVFQSLHNYYEHHTYTDIGNNLLNTYERFFLPYENAHPEDRQNVPCAKCKQGHIECTKWDRWGQMVSCDGCDTWYHVDCCEPGSVRRGRQERITSFLCAVCGAAATNVGGIDHSTRSGEPSVKRTRDEIDAVGCARVDDFYERHLAMRRRRNRKQTHPASRRGPGGGGGGGGDGDGHRAGVRARARGGDGGGVGRGVGGLPGGGARFGGSVSERDECIDPTPSRTLPW